MTKGRPKGSKNKQSELATTVTVPPSCRKCGSEDIVRRAGARVRVQEYAGEYNGIPFRAIKWVPSMCRSCGQSLTVRHLIGGK